MPPSPARPKRNGHPRLVALGDLSLDIVVAPSAEIATGSDVDGTVTFRVGGSAANVATSFTRLGGAGVFVGAVGDDAIGRRLVRALRASGVRCRVVRRAPSETARIAVILALSGERSFVTARGAADDLTTNDLRRSWFRGAAALHLPAYSLLHEPMSSAARQAAEWVHAEGGLVSVDLASAAPLRALGPDRSRQAVSSVMPDIVFANADEAAVFASGLDDLAPTVVVKRGSAGCDVGGVHVPTERVESMDTTGAGDAFDAGFLLSLLGGSEPVAAARAAHEAAARLLTTPRNEVAL